MGAHVDKWLGPHSWGLNSSTLICMALFWMLFEFSATIANAVYVALINDVVPQPVLGRFFGLFRALSLIAGIIFNHWYMGKAETAYVWIFLGMAAIYGIGVTLMCLMVKEGEYPPKPPMDAGRNIHGFIQAAVTYFQECFGNKYYWWLFGSLTLAGVGIGGPVNLFSIFFAKSVHMDLSFYGNCRALTYGVSLALAYPLGWLADRFHPLRVGMVTLAIYAFVDFAGGFFARDAQTFAVALVAHGVVTGIWNTSTASLLLRLLPKAEFAQFASAGGMIAAVAWMLLAPISGFFLDHLNHDYRYTFFMGLGLTFLGLAWPAGGSPQVYGPRRPRSLPGARISSVLLALAVRALGADQVVAILGVSPSLASDERFAAHQFAAVIGARVVEIQTREGYNPAYRANGLDRCFHCKDELFTRIDEVEIAAPMAWRPWPMARTPMT